MDKKLIKSLIDNAETGKAIEAFLALARGHGFPNLEKSLAILLARYNKWKHDDSLGLLDYRDSQLTINQINAAVLDLLDAGLGEDLPKPPAPDGTNKRQLLFLLAALAVVAFFIIKFAGANSSKAFNLTVFVHGGAGVHDLILKNQGKVVLHIGQDLREASINEKGEADFKEIPAEFQGKKARIVVHHEQPYQSAHPDSLYELAAGAAIYIEAALQGTGKIAGTVFDFDSGEPLQDVRVSIRNADVYTDRYGWFELDIPVGLQAKFQRVSFQKAGYEFTQNDSIPVHTQQEIMVSLKKKK